MQAVGRRGNDGHDWVAHTQWVAERQEAAPCSCNRLTGRPVMTVVVPVAAVATIPVVRGVFCRQLSMSTRIPDAEHAQYQW